MTTPLPGRVVIARRALESTIAAIAADELGTRRREVSTRVGDSGGRLAVSVTGSVGMPRLGSALERSVLETAEAVRSRIHHDAPALTGAALSEVRVRISTARITSSRHPRNPGARVR